ncbi:hypothetical protein D3C80_1439160 [compost metagenome]
MAPALEQPAGVAKTDDHAEEQQQLDAIAGVGEQDPRRQIVVEHLQHAGDEDEQQGQRHQAVGDQQLAHLLDGHATAKQKIFRRHGAGQGDHGAIVDRRQQVLVQHLWEFLLVRHITSFLLDAVRRG